MPTFSRDDTDAILAFFGQTSTRGSTQPRDEEYYTTHTPTTSTSSSSRPRPSSSNVVTYNPLPTTTTTSRPSSTYRPATSSSAYNPLSSAYRPQANSASAKQPVKPPAPKVKRKTTTTETPRYDPLSSANTGNQWRASNQNVPAPVRYDPLSSANPGSRPRPTTNRVTYDVQPPTVDFALNRPTTGSPPLGASGVYAPIDPGFDIPWGNGLARGLDEAFGRAPTYPQDRNRPPMITSNQQPYAPPGPPAPPGVLENWLGMGVDNWFNRAAEGMGRPLSNAVQTADNTFGRDIPEWYVNTPGYQFAQDKDEWRRTSGAAQFDPKKDMVKPELSSWDAAMDWLGYGVEAGFQTPGKAIETIPVPFTDYQVGQFLAAGGEALNRTANPFYYGKNAVDYQGPVKNLQAAYTIFGDALEKSQKARALIESLPPEQKQNANMALSILNSSGGDRAMTAANNILNQEKNVANLIGLAEQKQTELQAFLNSRQYPLSKKDAAYAQTLSYESAEFGRQAQVLKTKRKSDFVDDQTNVWGEIMLGVITDPTNFISLGPSKEAVEAMRAVALMNMSEEAAVKALTEVIEPLYTVQAPFRWWSTTPFSDEATTIAEQFIGPDVKKWLGYVNPLNLRKPMADTKAHTATSDLFRTSAQLLTDVTDKETARAVLGAWATDPLYLVEGVMTPSGLYKIGGGVVANAEVLKHWEVLRQAGDALINMPALKGTGGFNPVEVYAKMEDILYKAARSVNGLQALQELPSGAIRARVRKMEAGQAVIEYLGKKGEVISTSLKMPTYDAEQAYKALRTASATASGRPANNALLSAWGIQKAILSDMHMGLNPGYWLKNAVSATVHLMADDTYTLLPKRTIINDITQKVGVMPTTASFAAVQGITGGGVTGGATEEGLHWLERLTGKKNWYSKLLNKAYSIPYGNMDIGGRVGIGEENFRLRGFYVPFQRYIAGEWDKATTAFGDGLATLGIDPALVRSIAGVARDTGINGNKQAVDKAIRTLVSKNTLPYVLSELGVPQELITPAGWTKLNDAFASFGPDQLDEATATVRTIFQEELREPADILNVAPPQPSRSVFTQAESLQDNASLVDTLVEDAKRAGGDVDAAKAQGEQIAQQITEAEQTLWTALRTEIASSENPQALSVAADVLKKWHDWRQNARQMVDVASKKAKDAGTTSAWNAKWQETARIYGEFPQWFTSVIDEARAGMISGQGAGYDWFDAIKRYVAYDDEAIQTARTAGMGLASPQTAPSQWEQAIDASRQYVDKTVVELFSAFKRYPTQDGLDMIDSGLRKAEEIGAATARFLAKKREELLPQAANTYYKVRNQAWAVAFDNVAVMNRVTQRLVLAQGIAQQVAGGLKWVDDFAGGEFQLVGKAADGFWEAMNTATKEVTRFADPGAKAALPSVPQQVLNDFYKAIGEAEGVIDTMVEDLLTKGDNLTTDLIPQTPAVIDGIHRYEQNAPKLTGRRTTGLEGLDNLQKKVQGWIANPNDTTPVEVYRGVQHRSQWMIDPNTGNLHLYSGAEGVATTLNADLALWHAGGSGFYPRVGEEGYDANQVSRTLFRFDLSSQKGKELISSGGAASGEYEILIRGNEIIVPAGKWTFVELPQGAYGDGAIDRIVKQLSPAPVADAVEEVVTAPAVAQAATPTRVTLNDLRKAAADAGIATVTSAGKPFDNVLWNTIKKAYRENNLSLSAETIGRMTQEEMGRALGFLQKRAGITKASDMYSAQKQTARQSAQELAKLWDTEATATIGVPRLENLAKQYRDGQRAFDLEDLYGRTVAGVPIETSDDVLKLVRQYIDLQTQASDAGEAIKTTQRYAQRSKAEILRERGQDLTAAGFDAAELQTRSRFEILRFLEQLDNQIPPDPDMITFEAGIIPIGALLDSFAKLRAGKSLYEVLPGLQGLDYFGLGQKGGNLYKLIRGLNDNVVGALGDKAPELGEVASHTIRSMGDAERRIIARLPEILAGKPNSMTPAQQVRVIDALNQLLPQYDNVLAGAVRVGEKMADYSMLNYNDKRYIDAALGFTFGFHFYYTRTGWNWIKRAIHKPGIVNLWYETQRGIGIENEQSNVPDHLRGTIPNPLPVGPERLANPLTWMLPFASYMGNEFVNPDEAKTEGDRYAMYVQKYLPGLMPILGFALAAQQDQTSPLPNGKKRTDSFQVGDYVPLYRLGGYAYQGMTGDLGPQNFLGWGDEYDYGRAGKQVALQGMEPGADPSRQAWALDVGHQRQNDIGPLPEQPKGVEPLWEQGAQAAGWDRFQNRLGSFLAGVPAYSLSPEEQQMRAMKEERIALGYDPETNPYGSRGAVWERTKADGDLWDAAFNYSSLYPGMGPRTRPGVAAATNDYWNTVNPIFNQMNQGAADFVTQNPEATTKEMGEFKSPYFDKIIEGTNPNFPSVPNKVGEREGLAPRNTKYMNPDERARYELDRMMAYDMPGKPERPAEGATPEVMRAYYDKKAAYEKARLDRVDQLLNRFLVEKFESSDPWFGIAKKLVTGEYASELLRRYENRNATEIERHWNDRQTFVEEVEAAEWKRREQVLKERLGQEGITAFQTYLDLEKGDPRKEYKEENPVAAMALFAAFNPNEYDRFVSTFGKEGLDIAYKTQLPEHPGDGASDEQLKHYYTLRDSYNDKYPQAEEVRLWLWGRRYGAANGTDDYGVAHQEAVQIFGPNIFQIVNSFPSGGTKQEIAQWYDQHPQEAKLRSGYFEWKKEFSEQDRATLGQEPDFEEQKVSNAGAGQGYIGPRPVGEAYVPIGQNRWWDASAPTAEQQLANGPDLRQQPGEMGPQTRWGQLSQEVFGNTVNPWTQRAGELNAAMLQGATIPDKMGGPLPGDRTAVPNSKTAEDYAKDDKHYRGGRRSSRRSYYSRRRYGRGGGGGGRRRSYGGGGGGGGGGSYFAHTQMPDARGMNSSLWNNTDQIRPWKPWNNNANDWLYAGKDIGPDRLEDWRPIKV